MRQALVTGGGGFIGQHLVTTLLAHGRRVRILDLRPPRYAATAVQYVQGSILDPELLQAALDDVDEVYHLAGLPGMWIQHKDDFHTVNAQGTASVIAAARKRGVSRFLHCSTESILFRPSCTASALAEDVSVTLEQMPGAYTRSKMLGEQQALQAAASGFPVVIANPTMPIGPHNGNLTPPTLMLQYFLKRRVQIYLDFIMEPCRRPRRRNGFASCHGAWANRATLHSRWRKHLTEKTPRYRRRDQRPQGGPHSNSCRRRTNNRRSVRIHRRSCDPYAAGRHGRGRSDRVTVPSLVNRKSAPGTRLCTASNWRGLGRGATIYSKQVARIDQPRHNRRTGLQRVA
jgi:dTDP-4-dehydrorhamnose reductase